MRRLRWLWLLVIAGAVHAQAPRPPDTRGAIVCTFDGQGSALVAGAKFDIWVPFGGRIFAASMLADQSGSAVVEIRKCTYAQYDAGSTHPVTDDKINASAPLTISSDTKSTDSTLDGWTTSFTTGDCFEFYLSSADTIQRLTITVFTQR